MRLELEPGGVPENRKIIDLRQQLSGAGVDRGMPCLVGRFSGRDDVLNLSLGSEESDNTTLLVGPEPWLAGFTENSLTKEIDELTEDDQNKGNGVHPVNVVVEDLDTDDNTPKVHGKH